MSLAIWIVVAVGGLLTALGFVTSETSAFFSAWLFSTLFVLSFPLGSLGLRILHQLTSGGWGDAATPVFRAATKTLPFMALPIAVIFVGMSEIYPWVDIERVSKDPILLHKSGYLNPNAFILRAGVYFAVYIACSTGIDRAAKRGETWMFAGPGLVLYGLVSSFFAVDFGMSLEPHWFSTIYPLIVIVGHGIAALALALFVISRRPTEANTIVQFHDLGKLLFAFIMLWGYTVFSQLLIIWSANTAEEVPFYLRRLDGGWEMVTLGLFAFGFVVPFLALLSKEVKRNTFLVGIIATWLIGIRMVENAWLVLPAFEGRGINPFDFGVPLLLAGGWAQLFLRFWKRDEA